MSGATTTTLKNLWDRDSVLIAMVLGDSTMRKWKNSQLVSRHKVECKDYNEWKRNLLRPFFAEDSLLDDFDNYPKPVTIYTIYANHKLNPIYKAFYGNSTDGVQERKKRLNRHLLNRLTDLGLAIWIMDDGNFYIRQGKTAAEFTLSTDCFTKEENEIVKDWFKEKYGVTVRVSRNDKDGWRICGSALTSWILGNIVKEYIKEVPSMRYKIEWLEKASEPRSWGRGRRKHSLNSTVT